MTQAKAKFATFRDYLVYSNAVDLQGRYQLIDGELVQLPPESEPNDFIADTLQFYLAIAKATPRRLIKTHTCEVQVPVLQPNHPANRFPDIVILREEHLALTQRRLTITLEMPPPRLIAEVVSPGKANWERDYIDKRAQYAALEIPEYWLINPDARTVTVLSLVSGDYEEVGTFKDDEAIASTELSGVSLKAEQLFEAAS